MPFIKICGITNLEDAQMCIAAGADALGFNFYPPSPRYVEPLVVREIISQLPERVLTFGVFVNEETAEMVEATANMAGVAGIQLHGDETPEYCRQLSHRQVIKAVAIGPDFHPEQTVGYSAQTILLDAFDRRIRGGTGKVIDWSIAKETCALVPRMLLAGGLGPDNVGSALKAVKPFGVDACSRLEVRGGKKDPSLVQEFIRAARAPFE